jgi:hypothetical protein
MVYNLKFYLKFLQSKVPLSTGFKGVRGEISAVCDQLYSQRIYQRSYQVADLFTSMDDSWT